jgi:putative ABC transport system permease protein
MEQLIWEDVGSRRFVLLLIAVFAALALILTLIGIHGVISYSVAQRTQEIGIRRAVGAQDRDVLKLVLQQGLLCTAVGIGLGLAGAWGLTRVLASYLYEVRPLDPATFCGVSGLLAVAALAASYFPARRAAGIDPAAALRHE